MFYKRGNLRNFAKFTGKHLCQKVFFNKVAGPRPANLLKKTLRHRCFPMNFGRFLRTPLLQNTSGGCFCTRTSPGDCFWYLKNLTFKLLILNIWILTPIQFYQYCWHAIIETQILLLWLIMFSGLRFYSRVITGTIFSLKILVYIFVSAWTFRQIFKIF